MNNLRFLRSGENRKDLYFCLRCGGVKYIDRYNVKYGYVCSCGCLKKDQLAKRNKENATHGMSNAEGIPGKLYSVWGGMRRRCYDETSASYKWYGARGIEICDEWRKDFQPFYTWAISHGYTEELTIDRIDNDGNYSPENCRFVTIQENSQNNSSTKNTPQKVRKMRKMYNSGIGYQSISETMDIPYNTVYQIVNRLRWDNIE